MPGAVTERGFSVRGLGEIAIRCRDLDAMEAFYRDVIGLAYLAERSDGIVFFELGAGHGGHTQVLALFERAAGRPDLHPRADTAPATGAGSSLHHLALGVARREQAAIMAWYEARGIDYRVQDFDWIGWRGIFATDPDGNTVELVAGPEDAP